MKYAFQHFFILSNIPSLEIFLAFCDYDRFFDFLQTDLVFRSTSDRSKFCFATPTQQLSFNKGINFPVVLVFPRSPGVSHFSWRPFNETGGWPLRAAVVRWCLYFSGVSETLIDWGLIPKLKNNEKMHGICTYFPEHHLYVQVNVSVTSHDESFPPRYAYIYYTYRYLKFHIPKKQGNSPTF